MKDITITSFGLVIAYLVPGMTGLYGLALWVRGLQRIFAAFLTAESTVGLFLLVVMAALVMGLFVNCFRWFIFERWSAVPLKSEELAKLARDKTTFEAYVGRLDENFRYHQAYGGLAIAWPILCSGWLRTLWSSWNWLHILASLIVAFVIEMVAVLAAREALKRFREWCGGMLKLK